MCACVRARACMCVCVCMRMCSCGGIENEEKWIAHAASFKTHQLPMPSSVSRLHHWHRKVSMPDEHSLSQHDYACTVKEEMFVWNSIS